MKGGQVGQKVNPIGFRVGITQGWRSKWFAEKKDFGRFLGEDLKIRKYIKEKLHAAGVARIIIEKSMNRMRINILSSRPGIIIGRRGEAIDRLKEEINELTDKEVHIDIEEVKVPELDAQLVADNIALQIVRRVAYRRAMKRAISNSMSLGCQGIKILIRGRLAGAEIARSEKYKEGKIPLHTIRADIDYGFAIAYTTYGTIGVKVWIYKGDILLKKREKTIELEEPKKQKEIAIEKETKHVSEETSKT